MIEVWGVIPARYGATRFPGKPLAPILGVPMIVRVLQQVQKSKVLNRVLVATDDQRIADAVAAVGGQFVMTPSDLPSGSDRVWAAVQSSIPSSKAPKVVVNIQGDEPLMDPELIDEVVAPLLRSDIEMATASTRLKLEELEDMNIVKLVRDDHSCAMYFSRFAIPYTRKEPEGELICRKHIGIYAYQTGFLEKFCATPAHPLELAEGLEQLRALSMGARIYTIDTDWVGAGVDVPGDIQKVENMMKGQR